MRYYLNGIQTHKPLVSIHLLIIITFKWHTTKTRREEREREEREREREEKVKINSTSYTKMEDLYPSNFKTFFVVFVFF